MKVRDDQKRVCVGAYGCTDAGGDTKKSCRGTCRDEHVYVLSRRQPQFDDVE